MKPAKTIFFILIGLLCTALSLIISPVIRPAYSAEVVAPITPIAPKVPRLDFVYEAKVRLGEQVNSGLYDGKQRGTLQLLGGTFEGPAIRGKILPSTHDWPVYLGNGVRTTDVAYTFITEDGQQLFVTVDGFRYDPVAMQGSLLESENVEPVPNLLRVFIKIHAPDNSRYAWMNYNLFVGVAGQATSGAERIATLRVYRLL